jgi:Lon protease-like protein
MIPLFPLGTVLFPGGVMSLKIFEPRYLDMISTCLRTGSGFGINLIKSGSEVGEAANCWPVGTYARVTDWHSLPGGLLGITVRGERRYRVIRTQVEPDNLLMAEVEWLSEKEDVSVSELEDSSYAWLRKLLDQYGLSAVGRGVKYGAVSALVWRLAETLPLSLAARQTLLELDSVQDLLTTLQALLQGLV